MADKIKMKTKTRVKKPQLTIDNVQELGGTKEDLELLADLEDDSDRSDQEHDEEDFNSEPIKKDEVKDFLKSLEIYKYRPVVEGEEKKDEKKKKKVKLLKSKDTEENEDEPSTSTETKVEGKKKERNKYKHEEVSSTTRDPMMEYKSHMTGYKPKNYLLVKTGGDFLDNKDDGTPEGKKMSDDMTRQMEDFAAKLLQDEITVYNKQKEGKKRSDVGWMKTVLTSGTLADKIAALTVLVQESPIHNLANLDTLVNMTRKKGKRENVQATDTLKELFLSEMIPDDRKLKHFSQRPLSNLGAKVGWNKDTLDKKLILWYFESKLKDTYENFVKALQEMSHDSLLATKQKAINTVYYLLVNKPEQEKPLLSLLINKVGDPHYKLASTVSHLLTKLVEKHPNMKAVVVREVEQLLFRSNISTRAQYYSVCFMNQLKLSHKESDLASKVIKIYFSFFKAFIKKGEVDSKMMSALLSGVNRAYPYAKLNEDFLSEQMEHLYKIVHIVNFNTSIQALMLLYQVMDSSENTSERYYVALYKKLADPAMKTSSKQAIFLNILFKSMKKDESDRRVKAFMKRLLQVCSYQQPQFTCGALILMSEVLKNKPGLLTISHVEEDSDEEEHFVDQPDPDIDTATVVAATDGDVGDGDVAGDKPTAPVTTHHKPAASSWVHRQNLNHKCDTTSYDPYHRNPQYCHAENACVWELENMAQHFHPTVSLFAKQILKGEHVNYTGDPLQDFTLIRFLDRFVYKNPKKQDQIEERHSTLSRHKYAPTGVKSYPVTSDRFLKLKEKVVPVDDIFYHRYFQQKAASAKKAAGNEDVDSDADDVSDGEFDDFLEKFEGQFDEDGIADFGLDFAAEFGKKKKGKGGKDGSESDDDTDDGGDDDDDYDDDNLSDEELDFDDDELAKAFRDEMGDAGEDGDDFNMDDNDDDDDDDDEGGFDEEDVEFSDDDEFKDLMPKGKKRKGGQDFDLGVKKGKKAKDGPGLFAAAEEFASLIDDNSGYSLDQIGTDAFANKDKANVKQLKWEAERDKWIKGGNVRSKTGGRKGGNFSKKPGQGKQTGFKRKQGKRN